ncbi:FAD-dependent oxidoreductase [Alcaligenaceae bacterium]|nr:FAD-dependent oxidoreductase [Alcaligenaceae bacterium]
MRHERGMLIVGAAAAGLSAAQALRQAGYAGGITLLGGEAELPYDRPPLSKHFIGGDWTADRLSLSGRAELESLNVDLRLGVPAVSLDIGRKAVTIQDGSVFEYGKLLIATGVRPRRINGLAGLVNVHHLRTIGDACRIKQAIGPGRRIAIVGAGFVGTELAATARQMRAEVVLIEQGAALAGGRLGAVAGARLHRLHEDYGVRMHLGNQRFAPVVRQDRVVALALDSGEAPCDELVVAIGAQPCTDWLAGNGLDLSNGVRCDAFCRAAPDVYAAGDVACWFHPGYGRMLRIEHRTNATEQGAAAARNMLGEMAPYAPLPFFWSDQYDVKIQSFGVLSPGARQRLLHGDPDGASFVVGWYEQEQLAGVVGWNAFRSIRQYLPSLDACRQVQPMAAE